MKITHFLQGLKDDTAMSFATALKAEPGIVTFEDFYNSFSAKLSTILSLTQSASGNSQRQIIQCNTQQQEVLSGFFLLIVLYICLKPTSLLSSIYVMLIFIPLNRKRMYSNSSKIRSSVIFPCKIEWSNKFQYIWLSSSFCKSFFTVLNVSKRLWSCIPCHWYSICFQNKLEIIL